MFSTHPHYLLACSHKQKTLHANVKSFFILSQLEKVILKQRHSKLNPIEVEILFWRLVFVRKQKDWNVKSEGLLWSGPNVLGEE